MRTRNQLGGNGNSGGCGVEGVSLKPTNDANETGPTNLSANNKGNSMAVESNCNSPTTPRLRDRKPANLELNNKSSANSSSLAVENGSRLTITSNSTTPANEESSVSTKRSSSSSGHLPTRTLPRRSCIGRSNSSLLASTQLATNSSATSSLNKSSSSTLNKTSTNQQTPSNSTNSNSINNSRKDTHQHHNKSHLSSSSTPQVPKTKDGSNSSLLEAPLELLTTNKTANIKNYSRETPLTRSAMVSKPPLVKHDNRLTAITTAQINKAPNNKLVRISLPDNVSANGVGSSASDYSGTQNGSLASLQDKNRYMFTINGLKRVGTVDGLDLTMDDSSLVTSDQNSLVASVGVEEPRNSIIRSRKVFNILLGVTGSVAAVKLVDLVKKIKSLFPRPYINPNGTTIQTSVNFKIIMTQNSKHFAKRDDLLKNLNDPAIQFYDDADEWSIWNRMGDPVLHIELRKWADLCLIAPLDANTMAKLSSGICDNLLTCVVRAWDTSKPLVYCPAMNVHMYNHPITRDQLSKLQSYGYLRVDCIEKQLACGDFGIGAMASVDSIANKVLDTLIQPGSRKGSLTKPLLNQQPTYPIISTTYKNREGGSSSSHYASNSRNSSSTGNQILDRFRVNNQITVHAVPGMKNSKNAIDSIAAELALKRRRKMNTVESNDKTQTTNQQSVPSTTNSNNQNGGHKMGGVTSIQNLKAISSNNESMDCEEDVAEVDDEGFDFDPSKLLEQSMVTDDDPRNSTSLTLGSNTIQSSFESKISANSFVTEPPAPRASAMSTPLFNTSKFLALCHNKEKDCFTCTICKHDYKNRKSMARHLKEQHVQGSIFECVPCGVSYKRREKLIKHNRERHPEN